MKYKITEELISTNSMGPNPIKLLEWNLQNITVSPESKILDLGSGTGLTAVYLANEFDTDVIAYDKDIHPNKALETMLKYAPARMPLPLKGDARALPFPKNILTTLWQQIPSSTLVPTIFIFHTFPGI